MRRKRTRRQSHGSAWHWKQTDCWYYTLPGTKKRIPLFDEDGNRIRGKENKQAAQLALARVRLDRQWQPEAEPASAEEWLVARVCSEYLQYCERGVNPWKKVTGVARFLALKRKLGWDQDPVKKKYSYYSCRHTFAHRMLSGYWNGGAGCSIETLAELIGDTPKVAFDHYGREWGQHYQDPLWTAIGVPASNGADRGEIKTDGRRRAKKSKRASRQPRKNAAQLA